MRDFHNTENPFVGYVIIILQCELRKDELAVRPDQSMNVGSVCYSY